jgi:hypothetical protein
MASISFPVEWNDENPFFIGEENYNKGGMEYHIEAAANRTGDNPEFVYEAAFRSVLVYNNISNANLINAGAVVDFGATNPADGTVDEHYPENQRNLVRLWIRGGDAVTGDTVTPDFPLARDRTLWRKVRLFTPIARTVFRNEGDNANLAQNAAAGVEITNDNIPGEGTTPAYNPNGQYLWFWVTWRLPVNAYINFMTGRLPTGEELVLNDPQGQQKGYQSPRHTKNFSSGWAIEDALAYYPVIPGRTTIVEPLPQSNLFGLSRSATNMSRFSNKPDSAVKKD